MDSFDADVLIFAAARGHPLGRRVLALFPTAAGGLAGTGSVLLLPEILGRPLADGDAASVRALSVLLARLDLRPLDSATAELATVLAAKYRIRAADAVHLATAVNLGADRFITHNERDFARSIEELQVTYPEDLPDAPG
jgi:predicted nucleic acid-binding protein